MLIGLIGPKLSGKGTAAAYIQKTHGAQIYSMSGILSEVLDRLHISKTRAHMIGLVTRLREEFGEDILAQVLKADIEKQQPPMGIIDGIRMPMEVSIFSQLPDFRLIYIDAPVRTRYERALSRGEKEGESDMSYDDFLKEEQAVTEQNIAQFKSQAYTSINNDASLEALYKQLDASLT